ncbi:MAG: hypothetical protein V4580_02225 [Bacteroidota bacterium]
MTYCLCLIMAFLISLPAQAQRSSLDTRQQGETVSRKERKMERKRANYRESNSANAENRLSGKPQYKARTKMKVKHEKAPSEKRRRHRDRKTEEVRA